MMGAVASSERCFRGGDGAEDVAVGAGGTEQHHPRLRGTTTPSPRPQNSAPTKLTSRRDPNPLPAPLEAAYMPHSSQRHPTPDPGVPTSRFPARILPIVSQSTLLPQRYHMLLPHNPSKTVIGTGVADVLASRSRPVSRTE